MWPYASVYGHGYLWLPAYHGAVYSRRSPNAISQAISRCEANPEHPGAGDRGQPEYPNQLQVGARGRARARLRLRLRLRLRVGLGLGLGQG